MKNQSPVSTGQPLANVLVQHARNGSTFARSNVTPAEVFVLTADFRMQAGKDPILKLDIIDEDREDKMILPLQEKLSTLRLQLEENETKQDITEEVRHNRARSLGQRIVSLEKNILEWQHIKAIRGLGASGEKARLKMRYQSKLVEHLFPGNFPSVPSTFSDAKTTGMLPEIMKGLSRAPQDNPMFTGGVLPNS